MRIAVIGSGLGAVRARLPRGAIGVALNDDDVIDRRRGSARLLHDHSPFAARALPAQRRYDKINEVNRAYYFGACWGCGFHADCVNGERFVWRYLEKDTES